MSEYWQRVRLLAAALDSNGCSRPATQAYNLACLEHDVHYRTHRTVSGRWISKLRADARLWWRVWEFGLAGLEWHPRTWHHLKALPLGPVRFLAVTLGGWPAWMAR